MVQPIISCEAILGRALFKDSGTFNHNFLEKKQLPITFDIFVYSKSEEVANNLNI